MASETVLKSTYMDEWTRLPMQPRNSAVSTTVKIVGRSWYANPQVAIQFWNSCIPPDDRMCEVNLDSDSLP